MYGFGEDKSVWGEEEGEENCLWHLGLSAGGCWSDSRGGWKGRIGEGVAEGDGIYLRIRHGIGGGRTHVIRKKL